MARHATTHPPAQYARLQPVAPCLPFGPFAGMNVTQVGIWLSFIIVPGLLTLLPATKAGVLWSVSFTQQALLQTWGSGVTFPTLHLGPLAFLLPPLASCYLAGMASASCLGIRPKHIELLRDAVRSADAYFRLAAARQPNSPSTTYRAGDAVRTSADRPGVPQYGGSVFASSSSLTLEQDLSESEGEDSSCEASSSAGTAEVAADAFKTLSMVRVTPAGGSRITCVRSLICHSIDGAWPLSFVSLRRGRVLKCAVCACCVCRVAADLACVPPPSRPPGVHLDRPECDVLQRPVDGHRRHDSAYHGGHAACSNRGLAGQPEEQQHTQQQILSCQPLGADQLLCSPASGLLKLGFLLVSWSGASCTEHHTMLRHWRRVCSLVSCREERGTGLSSYVGAGFCTPCSI